MRLPELPKGTKHFMLGKPGPIIVLPADKEVSKGARFAAVFGPNKTVLVIKPVSQPSA